MAGILLVYDAELDDEYYSDISNYRNLHMTSDENYDLNFEYYENFYSQNREDVQNILNNCVLLSILSIYSTVTTLVGLNFCFCWLISTAEIGERLFHICTAIVGMVILNTLDSTTGKTVLIVCFILSYILLILSNCLKNKASISSGTFIKFVSVISLILCEYFLVNGETWGQIRGVLMILVMKLISLADDIDATLTMPSALQYFGYVLCGANVMFGPWISYETYLNLYYRPPKKTIGWIVGICQTLITSFIFLSISNCWANYFIPDDSNRWFVGYRDALAFRTSHYFVCYLSEAGMIAAGFRNTKQRVHRYIITEPFDIEFPSSLAIVVKKWNQPMHEFLKKYIYRSLILHGRFFAFVATFVMSSFLHGFEMKVSMVLINIGIFSYLQVAPRNKLAGLLDCCIQVRPCRECHHKYKRNDIRVRAILFIFSLTSVLHLMYLGIVMDPLTDDIGIISRWSNLYFISHIIMVFNGLLQLFLSKSARTRID